MPSLEETREEKLEDVHRQEEEQRTEALAEKSNSHYINLAKVPVQRDSLHYIPQAEAERAGIIVIQQSGKTLKVGALDSSNKETVQIIERLKAQGFNVGVFLISRSSFKKALGEFKFIPTQIKGAATSGQVSLEQVEALKKEITNFAALKEKLGQISTGETSILLELFLSSALNLDASDIHVEPQQNQVQIRFRLDGVLQDAGTITATIYQSALSRIKLLSGLQLNVQNIPQDGRFTIKESGLEVEIRTSVLPGAYGEYIVLRILNPNAIKLEIKDLGLRDYLWQPLEQEIKKTSGIILVTGPTGSGKTTTLYAFLKYLNKPGIKIITLEDPIEYHLQGVDQSQIEPEKGYTFAQGLRSVLRQGPNVILVGEIRDEETADVALHAALTGHLVFSTLHTNDAVGAIPRFLDLNAKPQILASALNAAVAQRLVRKLCAACKKEKTVDASVLDQIKKDLDPVTLNAEAKKELNKLLGVKNAIEELGPTTKKSNGAWPEEIKIYEAAGCDKCGGTGYKGRIGVFEMLFVNEDLEKLIGQNPSHQQILAEAKKQGFTTMYQDGLMRVLAGETTLEEVRRVTSQEI